MKRLPTGMAALILAVAAFLGLANVIQLAGRMQPGSFVLRDFTQDYLMAKAIVVGLSPGMPVPEIARRLGMDVPGFFLDHPSPHPPPFALAITPLGLLPYGGASVAWLILSVIWLVAAVYLLGKLSGTPLSPASAVLLALALVLWDPVYADLTQGQVNSLLLMFLSGALLSLRAGKEKQAGMLIGAALLVKPMVWPVAGALLLHRQIRALVALSATVAAGYAISAAVLGPVAIFTYLTKTAPAMGSTYRFLLHNISLFSLGPKLFDSISVVEPSGAIQVLRPLLFHWPQAGQPAGALLAGGLVVVGAVLAYRLPLQRAIAVAVCVSILASPVAWTHYLVLCLLPLTVFGIRSPMAGVAVALLVPPYSWWTSLSLQLLGSVAYLAIMPTVAVLSVMAATALAPAAATALGAHVTTLRPVSSRGRARVVTDGQEDAEELDEEDERLEASG